MFIFRRVLVAVGIVAFTAFVAAADQLMPIEQLGKDLFFDTNLSEPPGLACAACHGAEVGFTGPDAAVNVSGAVYEGAVPGRFGNRKPPAAAYAGDSPIFSVSKKGGCVGGMFWDGRATGWTLGDPLAEQAQGPFLNPLEQNMPSAAAVVTKVRDSAYAELFLMVWGPGSLDLGNLLAYERIARSIAAYERSAEVNPYTSKFDYYRKGMANFTVQEKLGLKLFQGQAGCAKCHVLRPSGPGAKAVFTVFTYDNLGIPKNPANPYYNMPPEYNPDGANWVDPGLGGFLRAANYPEVVVQANWGKHKVPTLRNVDKRPSPGFVKAFGHNGFFKSLESIVHFYNTRDVGTWPPPEVPQNVNTKALGNLGLTASEEAAIVAFLKTLSDGYMPVAKMEAGGSGIALAQPGLKLRGPNPFNPSTTIHCSLLQAGRVKLAIYDVRGIRIATLIDAELPAGERSVQWNGTSDHGTAAPSGVYFARLETPAGAWTMKVALAK